MTIEQNLVGFQAASFVATRPMGVALPPFGGGLLGGFGPLAMLAAGGGRSGFEGALMSFAGGSFASFERGGGLGGMAGRLASMGDAFTAMAGAMERLDQAFGRASFQGMTATPGMWQAFAGARALQAFGDAMGLMLGAHQAAFGQGGFGPAGFLSQNGSPMFQVGGPNPFGAGTLPVFASGFAAQQMGLNQGQGFAFGVVMAAFQGGQTNASLPGGGNFAMPMALQAMLAAFGGAGGAGQPAGPVVEATGRIWGDPHFIGADGGKFDVQGEAGKVYNLLSDNGLQLNGRFDAWGSGGATVVGELGATIGQDQVRITKRGQVEINGQQMIGDRATLADGSTIERTDEGVKLTTAEYEIDVEVRRNSHLNIDFKSDNVNADGIMPHGLWGQTADGDGEARNGDKGRGAQGGGAIETLSNELTERGDKFTVTQYETGGLFDTDFGAFNRYHNGMPVATDQGVTPEMMAYFQETVQSAFATLYMASLMSQMTNGFGGSTYEI